MCHNILTCDCDLFFFVFILSQDVKCCTQTIVCFKTRINKCVNYGIQKFAPILEFSFNGAIHTPHSFHPKLLVASLHALPLQRKRLFPSDQPPLLHSKRLTCMLTTYGAVTPHTPKSAPPQKKLSISSSAKKRLFSSTISIANTPATTRK